MNIKQSSLLKIYYEDKTKRCELPQSFSELKEICMKNFPNMFIFDIFYMDEDKDFILIENDFDYDNALLYLKHNDLSTLKVSLRPPSSCLDSKVMLKCLDNSSINASKVSNNKEQDLYKIKLDDWQFLTENTLLSCEKCARRFDNRLSHAKHTKVCSKVFGQRRIPFDSRKQRTKEIMILQNKVSIGLGKLERALNKWKERNITANKNKNKSEGRSFKDLFVEVDKKQCINCKREFNEASYLKHANNCFRLTRRRIPFDSKKQRIRESEQEALQKKGEKLNKLLGIEKNNKKWKKMSDRFRKIMRISRLLFKRD